MYKIVHFLAFTVLPKQLFHMLRILFKALLEAYKKELQFLITKNTFATHICWFKLELEFKCINTNTIE